MMAKLVRGLVLKGNWESVLDAKKKLKSVRPKTSIEVRTGEHGAKGIAYGLMGALDGAVLVRGTGASGLDMVTKFLEEGTEFWIMVQFATLVNHNVLVREIKYLVLSEPRSKPIEGCGFRNARNTVEFTGGMVGNEQVASLTVEASEFILA
jgi:hypothetical protein